MSLHLRLYHAPDPNDQQLPEVFPIGTTPIRLKELLPLLTEAKARKMLWLDDFLEDDVFISADLLEVLRTVQEYRPTA